MKVRIHHHNDGSIIVEVTDYSWHGINTGQLTGTLATVTGNDFIFAAVTGPDDDRHEHPKSLNAFRCFTHGFVITHLVRMTGEVPQTAHGELYDNIRLGITLC